MQRNKMDRLLLCIATSFFCLATDAQRNVPSSYSANIPKNYVRTWDVMKPGANLNNLSNELLKDVKQSTQYIDGLGRQLQTVIKEGSVETITGTKKDMVSPVEYDQFGREQFKYLPTVSTTSDGLFKTDPFQQQAAFMNTQYGPQGETWFYSQTNFESSPLNRVTKTFAPGNSWVGSGRDIEMKYWINATDDDVKKWNVTDVANAFGIYSINGAYLPGELYKNVTVDEHEKQIVEFKDKEGKVILKKVQLTATADAGSGSGYPGWLCTYYIYDDFNNLRCVIQPEGVKTLSQNGWVIDYSSSGLAAEQCFRYEYDKRNRMIRKKIPGAGEVWMVYDKRDRLIMTQDAKLRQQGKWLYTFYDDLNRPYTTGITFDSHSQEYNANMAETTSPYPNLAAMGYEIHTHTFYDDYSWLPGYPVPSSFTANRITTYDNLLLSPSSSWPYAQAVQKSDAIRGLVTGSRIFIAELGYAGTIFYTVNYYDDKGRLIQTQRNNYNGGIDVTVTQYNWAGQPLLTIEKSDVTGPNALTTIVVTQMTYDDLGRLIKIEKKQSNSLVSVNGNMGAMSSFTTIATMDYDALGQMKKKTIGSKKDPANNYYSPRQPLEELNYDYNIRGWMLGANRTYLKDKNATGYQQHYFGFELGFDKCTTTPGSCGGGLNQFNGNISAGVWKSAGDEVRRKYNYWYDEANRFNKADFTQSTDPASGTNWNNSEMNYSVWGFDPDNGYKMKYDANGNILSMIQGGWKLSNPSAIIDALRYSYNDNSNRLKQVTDDYNDNDSKLGDFKYDVNSKTAVDYSYDINGNLMTDQNKKITSITYNHLNLPLLITVAGKGTIAYQYDALGNKIKKTTIENNVSVPFNGTNYTSNIETATYYIGGAVYESKSYSHPSLSSLYYSGVLQFIGHEEGRIRFKKENNTLQYDFLIKDHLGNVRMVLTEEQQTNPYPAATMEAGTINTEADYYGNLQNTQYTKPSWFSDPNYSTNAQVARIKNTSGVQKVGPNIILKVMAGDSYNIRVASGWNGGNATNSSTNVLNDLVSLLSTGMAGLSNGKATSADLQNTSSGLNTGLTNFLATQSTSGTKPKAYINWVLLDEQFKIAKDANGNMIANGYSGFDQVKESGSAYIHYLTNLTVAKSGYLYIYTSNEATDIDVFFDNLQVTHIRGPILEETHYYPFGLTMAGISSKALNFGSPDNKYKYNSIEKENDLQIEVYDAQLRELDGQIGIWWQIDPKTENMEMWSPYVSNYDNPVKYADPLGDEPQCCPQGVVPQFVWGIGEGIGNGAKGVWDFFTRDAWKGETWSNLGQNTLALGMGSQPTGMLSLMTFDNKFGTNLLDRSLAISQGIGNAVDNIPNMDARDWGNVTGQGVVAIATTKGLTAAPKVLSQINKVAATKFLAVTGDLKAFENVEGFSLRLGSTDFTYQSSMAAAKNSRWSTPISFSTSADAYNGLALNYSAKATNFAQVKVAHKSFGIFVKGTASAQGTTPGQATQLLKTKFSIKSNYQYRGSSISKQRYTNTNGF